MARAFSGTDLIDVGTGTTIDNMNIGTALAWVYYTNAAVNGFIWRKGTAAGANHAFQRLSTGHFAIRVARATTLLAAEAADASCAGSGVDKWVFFAATWTTSGANGDQRIYTGDRTTVAVEASAYSVQQVGAGTVGDDSGDNMFIGNNAAGSTPWPGRIGFLQVLKNVNLTLAQIRSWQWGMRWLTGTSGLWIPGHDNGTSVPDYSGNLNTGTITGTTVAASVPHLNVYWAGADGTEDERTEIIGGAGSGGMWPDRRRRARAAIYVMRNRRFRF